MPVVLQKLCSKCGVKKDLTKFTLDCTKLDGHYPRCKMCRRQDNKKYRKKDILRLKEWNRVNSEKTRQRISTWQKQNKTLCVKYSRNWQNKNRGKVNAAASLRRAKKLKATPTWANILSIREFYRNCPKGFHVDHILPLCGKNVTGLHVLSNLQYLSALENIKKGNRLFL